MTSKDTISDDIFTRLEEIITSSASRSSSPSNPAANVSSILQSLGARTTSISILDHGTITSHTITPASEPCTPSTLFQACSISKACTALGIARLIDQGVFKLSDKIHDLLPSHIVDSLTSDPRTSLLTRSITVKHLLSHTAGLSVGGFPGYPMESHPRETLPDPTQIIAGSQGVNTLQIKVIAPPGLGWMYSGGGMTLLQIIAEHTTGQKFEDVIQHQVLHPLGMTRSTYRLGDGEEDLVDAWYTGYTKCETRWHFQPELAAAGLWTTPGDLLRMVSGLQGSLRGGGFLGRDLAREVVTNVKMTMGLGWFCNEHTLGHGGSNNPGYRSTLFGYEKLPWNGEGEKRRRKQLKKKNEDGKESLGEDGREEQETDEASILEERVVPQDCGISIMANAATGSNVIFPIIHAISYLKGWPEGPMYYGVEAGAPFGIDGDIEAGKDTAWKAWIGEWADQGENHVWKVAKDEDGRPVAGVDTGEADVLLSRLRTAAIPPIKYKGGRQSVDLVLDGMQIMLRLGWSLEKGEEVRTVEMWHHQSQYKAVLYSI